MATKETDKQRMILAAAEAEFLENGYKSAKTTDIARRAGVTHAMLHYYFRTKENLFDMIFQDKVGLLSETLLVSFSKELPFLEKVKKGIEEHFDFIAANPRLPLFIFTEIFTNETLKNRLLEIVKPQITSIFSALQQEIEREAAKGSIHSVNAIDLIMNIISLNVFVFISEPVWSTVTGFDAAGRRAFLEHRKQNNVALVLGNLQKEQ